MNLKRMLWLWPIGVVVSLYTAFVLQNLWNWFGASAFHVSNISFWEMYGLLLLAGLLADRSSEEFGHSQQWKAGLTFMDASLPESKREEVEEKLKDQAESIWYEAGFMVLGKVMGNTATLAIGWSIHTFFA